VYCVETAESVYAGVLAGSSATTVQGPSTPWSSMVMRSTRYPVSPDVSRQFTTSVLLGNVVMIRSVGPATRVTQLARGDGVDTPVSSAALTR
jgi:hypothetical protein